MSTSLERFEAELAREAAPWELVLAAFESRAEDAVAKLLDALGDDRAAVAPTLTTLSYAMAQLVRMLAEAWDRPVEPVLEALRVKVELGR